MSDLCIAVRSNVVAVDIRSRKVDILSQPERVMVAVEQGAPGARGPMGPAGPAFDGTAWWYGEGEPDVGPIVGSKPGDYYVDTLTGVIYKLGD